MEILLYPVAVQGDAAPAQIAGALRQISKTRAADVVIVTRGGGSAEDLWVFNDEGVARAAYDCAVPLVSAIGHEIDFTILDFVADLRAPTPSAAAELVLPDMRAEIRQAMYLFTNIANNMQFRMDSWYNRLRHAKRQTAMAGPAFLVANKGAALRETARRLQLQAAGRMDGARQRMQAGAALASGLNPYEVLARGYAVASRDGRTVKSVAQAAVGDKIDLKLQDGTLGCRVEDIAEGGVAPAGCNPA